MRLSESMTGGATSESTLTPTKGGQLGVADWGMAIKVLTQYSDPIPSIVREITSNGFDAHREAAAIPGLTREELTNPFNHPTAPGKNYSEEDADYLQTEFPLWQPRNVRVILQAGNPMTGLQSAFKVQDFGIGLSEDRIESIFTVLLASTKRGSNDEHGAFGLGAKSPLSYADLFTVTTIWREKKSTYAIFKTPDGPRYELVTEVPTEETNGTTVEVPIKNDSDFNAFAQAVRTQLAYFNGIEYAGITINDPEIYRGESFYVRKNSPFTQMHAVIDGVVYPINWASVGYQAAYSYSSALTQEGGIAVPIGLRFDIGDLDIVWNRESLEYTDRTVTAIKARLGEARAEIQSLWDKQYEDIKNVFDLQKAILDRQNQELTLTSTGMVVPQVHKLISTDVRYPKYPEINSYPKELFIPFKVHRLIGPGGVEKPSYYGHSIGRRLVEGENLLFSTKPYTDKKNQFIADTLMTSFALIREETGASVSSLSGQLGFSKSLSCAERMAIVQKLWDEIKDYFLKHVISYDDITYSKEWEKEYEEAKIEARLRELSLKKEEIEDGVFEIPLRTIYYAGADGEYKWSMDKRAIKDIRETNALTIYGFSEDNDDLLSLAPLFFSQQRFLASGYDSNLSLNWKRVRILKIAMANEKHLNPERSIHVKTLLNDKTVFTTRYVTALRMMQLMPANLGSLNGEALEKAAPRLMRAVKFVKGYLSTYAPRDGSQMASSYGHTRVRERAQRLDDGLIALFEKNDFFDHDAIEQFNLIRLYLKEFPLLTSINFSTASAEEIQAYFHGKGCHNPALLHRLHRWKATRAQA